MSVFDRTQLTTVMFLVNEIEQVELERKRQNKARPWLNMTEIVDTLSARLVWPQGTINGIINELVNAKCLERHESGRAVRTGYAEVPTT